MRSKRSELHTLREVSLREIHAPLRTELAFLQQASYCAALIEQTTERETPLPEIFRLMRELLAVLAKHSPQAQTIFAFEFKLLNGLGLAPDLVELKLTPGAKQIAAKLIATKFEELSRLKLSEQQTRELRQFLHGFLIYHLGKIPNGRAAAIGEASITAK